MARRWSEVPSGGRHHGLRGRGRGWRTRAARGPRAALRVTRLACAWRKGLLVTEAGPRAAACRVAGGSSREGSL